MQVKFFGLRDFMHTTPPFYNLRIELVSILINSKLYLKKVKLLSKNIKKQILKLQYHLDGVGVCPVLV